MGSKGEKEFILSLYILQNPVVLENAIGMKLGKMEAEVPTARKKVDLLTINPCRRLPVYIETQIKPSDDLHLVKIIGIMDSVHEGVVVWIAQSFQQKHLEQITAFLKRNKQKYVSFHAVQVYPEYLSRVDELNKLYKLEIWYKLKQISNTEHPSLKQVYTYSQIPVTHTGRSVGTLNYDLSRVEGSNQYMLDSLRSKVPHFLNIWKSKKFNRFDCQLSLGAGKAGVSFKISTKNQQGLAGIFLYFDKNQVELYNRFKKDIQKYREKVNMDLSASNRKIGILFEPDPNLDVTISKLASILENMLKHFGPHLYAGFDSTKLLENESNDSFDDIEIMKDWMRAGLPGVDPKLAELLTEEADNEQANRVNRERISEYLMHI